jgi:hypothetical protein
MDIQGAYSVLFSEAIGGAREHQNSENGYGAATAA